MSELESSHAEDGYEWDEDSELRVLERSLSPSKLQFLWGVLLLLVAVAGDLGAASLKLGQGSLAGFVIGLWLAQYLALWLVIQSYVRGRLKRILLGVLLSLGISMIVILGFNIAWRPGVPIVFVALIELGSVGIYLLAGWLQKLMYWWSDFSWLETDQTDSRQYSIRTMLGVTVLSAIFALGAKWIVVAPNPGRSLMVNDLISIGIWFGWIGINLGFLCFLLVGALRSEYRWFYVTLFGLALLLGPAAFQAVAYRILSNSSSFKFVQSAEHYRMAYAITLGVVVGIAMVIPLLPKRHARLFQTLPSYGSQTIRR